MPKVDVNDLRRPSTQWQGKKHEKSRHGDFLKLLILSLRS